MSGIGEDRVAETTVGSSWKIIAVTGTVPAETNGSTGTEVAGKIIAVAGTVGAETRGNTGTEIAVVNTGTVNTGNLSSKNETTPLNRVSTWAIDVIRTQDLEAEATACPQATR